VEAARQAVMAALREIYPEATVQKPEPQSPEYKAAYDIILHLPGQHPLGIILALHEQEDEGCLITIKSDWLGIPAELEPGQPGVTTAELEWLYMPTELEAGQPGVLTIKSKWFDIPTEPGAWQLKDKYKDECLGALDIQVQAIVFAGDAQRLARKPKPGADVEG
jgi:hypothetical protein